MFRLSLFKIRAFTSGNIAGLLGALGRGGIQFMLIIWLQGIWLPQHGYSFSQTPLWAGIAMIPLTVGFLIVGPLAGWLSDRHGARLFATTGLVVSGRSLPAAGTLPINFSYAGFAALIFLFAVGMGLFFSPNQAAVMNSLPPEQRGAGAGMLNTFQNSATVLSMGLFFTIVTLGLAARLPSALFKGLVAAGVSPAAGIPWPTSRRSAGCSRRSSATTRFRNCSGRPAPSSTCRRSRSRTSPDGPSSRSSSSSRSPAACTWRSRLRRLPPYRHRRLGLAREAVLPPGQAAV